MSGNGTVSSTGDGEHASSATLDFPNRLAFDSSGNLYISANARIRMINASTSNIETFAGNGTATYLNKPGDPIGDGGPATNATFNQVQGLAFDASGNLYVSDEIHNRVRMINATTRYIKSIAGNGSLHGIGGNNIIPTSSAVGMPYGLAFDSPGNLYIAEGYSSVVRMINASTGNITTIAGNGGQSFGGDGFSATNASLYYPVSLAFDTPGNLYIADMKNNRIRMVNASTGNITTIAGQSSAGSSGDGAPAISAYLNYPSGLAFDSPGNLYISDRYNNRIRMINASSGNITTVAGNGSSTSGGDGGPATNAAIASPSGLAFDTSGNLHIVDSGSSSIRIIYN